MTPTLIIVAVLSFVLGTLRPVFLYRPLTNKHAQKSYEAFAHILVGLLLSVFLPIIPHWFVYAFWILVAVEVLCGIVYPLVMKLLDKLLDHPFIR